jgi:hypothetical protein
VRVHVIYNPNRRDKSGEVRVHLVGCRDIRRDIEGGPKWSPATSDYETEGTSQQFIAEDFYADFIEEGSMTEADAMRHTTFLPCTLGLSVLTVHTATLTPNRRAPAPVDTDVALLSATFAFTIRPQARDTTPQSVMAEVLRSLVLTSEMDVEIGGGQ